MLNAFQATEAYLQILLSIVVYHSILRPSQIAGEVPGIFHVACGLKQAGGANDQGPQALSTDLDQCY